MNTIRRRLTRRLLLGWSLLLVIGGAIAWLTTHTALTRQFDDTLRTKAVSITTVVEQDSQGLQVDTSDEFMREFDTNNTSAFFQVWRADGSEVARSPSLHGGSLPLRHVAASEPEFWNIQMPSGQNARAMALQFQPRPANESQPKPAPIDSVLVVAIDRRGLDQSLATLALVLAGSGLLVLALTAAIVPGLLRRELAPLDRLAGQAQRITAESLAVRFSTDGLPGELAPISARLNDLLQRLQTSFSRERQFSDDLAHEFRTPIAELRSLAELSLKWPDARNADTDRNVLAVALQMEAIINRLLAIARSDQGRVPLEPKQIELTALISNISEPLEARAATRKLVIEADLPPALQIQSDPVLLRSIVTNLLDNAVEHSTAPGVVQIESEQRNGCFTLRVTNPAQQLSAEDVPHLFDRFWRKDAARSGGEHAGLGLPLARAFATSLGYTLAATLNGEARLTMTLSGPTQLKNPKAENKRELI